MLPPVDPTVTDIDEMVGAESVRDGKGCPGEAGRVRDGIEGDGEDPQPANPRTIAARVIPVDARLVIDRSRVPML